MATIEAVVHIGERLRRLREERALRQEDLALLAGIGKNTVKRIEKNRTEPHMTTIRKLADALEVDPAELVRGELISPQVANGAKRGTGKNITTQRILPSCILYYKTLPSRALESVMNSAENRIGMRISRLGRFSVGHQFSALVSRS